MRLEARKYLYDIQRAVALLTKFTASKAFADYARDAMLRERQAEAVKLDAAITANLTELGYGE